MPEGTEVEERAEPEVKKQQKSNWQQLEKDEREFETRMNLLMGQDEGARGRALNADVLSRATDSVSCLRTILATPRMDINLTQDHDVSPAAREYGWLLNLFHYKEFGSAERDLDSLFGTTLTAEERGFEYPDHSDEEETDFDESTRARLRDLVGNQSTFCRLLRFNQAEQGGCSTGCGRAGTNVRGTRPGPVRVVMFKVSQVSVTNVNLQAEEFGVEFWINFCVRESEVLKKMWRTFISERMLYDVSSPQPPKKWKSSVGGTEISVRTRIDD